MLRNTCCVVMPGNEANGVVRHHEPSAASVRLDGSVWPMTEPFIRHRSTKRCDVVDSSVVVVTSVALVAILFLVDVVDIVLASRLFIAF